MEDFLSDFVAEFIPSMIKNLGAFVRYLYLYKRFSFKEVLKQDWNHRIGLLFLIIVISIIILPNLG